jgi:heme-degrading monooxygenase HmoA
MYAVIFRAEIGDIDGRYSEVSARLRELAMSRYGCVEFTAVTEGAQEIAISYWRDLEQIKQWKQNAEHLAAQELGRSKWYKNYKVQIVQVEKEYVNP